MNTHADTYTHARAHTYVRSNAYISARKIVHICIRTLARVRTQVMLVVPATCYCMSYR